MAWVIEGMRDAEVTPEAVFALYADPGTWSTWGHNATWARAEGPLVEGGTVDVKANYGKVYPCLVRRLVDGRLLVLEARPPGLLVTQTYEVEGLWIDPFRLPRRTLRSRAWAERAPRRTRPTIRRSRPMGKRLGLASILAIGASFAIIPAVSAQGMVMSPHPAHIHAGTCPAPGDVVAKLSDISFAMNVDDASQAGADPVGQSSAIPVEASITTVKVPFADIVGGQHAVVVHKSEDDMGTYILCGDIGGTTVSGTNLPFGLGALNDSGANGVGWLHDNEDGTTTVTIFVVPPAGAMAGPMESPAT